MGFLSKTLSTKIEKAAQEWGRLLGGKIEFFSDSRKLKELLENDTTGVLTALKLTKLYADAKAEIHFSAEDILNEAPKTKESLSLLKLIKEIAEDPEITSVLQGVRDRITETAATFQAEEKIRPTLSTENIGALIESAESEIKTLRVHQFTQGDTRREKFYLNEWIYGFPTMHELVCALASQPVDGLTLCLLSDPEIPEYSVFAWALKTGTTLTVLSEDNGLSNRQQKFLRRNPGRDFERRASGKFYPYSIFDLKETSTASGSGTQVRISGVMKEGKPSNKQAIVKHALEAHRIQRIGALEPEEITWLILVADLIHREYWLEGKKTPELAYTGEMVDDPKVLPKLIESPSAKLALLQGPDQAKTETGALTTYQPIKLAPITSETFKKLEDPKLWEGPDGGRSGTNDWMVRRYEAKLQVQGLSKTNREALALPVAKHPHDDEPHVRFERTVHGGPETIKRPVISLSKDGKVTSHSMFLTGTGWNSTTPEPYHIQTFDPSGLFGTKEEIEREREYVARTNQATAIQALADQEFAQRHEEITNWFKTAVRKNLPALKAAIATGKLSVETDVRPQETSAFGFSNKRVKKQCNILVIRTNGKDENGEKLHYSEGLTQVLVSIHQGIQKKNDWTHMCCENGTATKSYARFNPTNAAGIATLAGVPQDSLPEFLQYWHPKNHEGTYTGNSILDLIDPIERMENPWRRVSFAVRIYFSKRALNRWKKGEFREVPEVLITHYPEYPLPRLFDIYEQ